MRRARRWWIAACLSFLTWPLCFCSGAFASTPSEMKCTLVLSTDQNFDDCWNHTAATTGPRIASSDKVMKGQEFIAYLFFSHGGRDQAGNAHIQYDVHITKPDGSTYYDAKGLEAFDGPCPADGVMLETQLVHVSFDPPDQIGEYKIRLVVHDQVSGQSVPTEATIQLVEISSDAHFTVKDEVAKWIEGYPESRHAEQAVDALLACAKTGMWTDKPTSEFVRAFFHELFEGDSFLFPILLSKYAQAGKVERQAILFLASHSKTMDPALLEKAAVDKAELRAMASVALRDPLAAPITDATGLDPIWAVFLASGKYAPVRRVCEIVDGSTGGSAPANARDNPSPGAVRTAALASITRRAADHKRVHDYVEWISENEKFSDVTRQDLKKVLGNKH